ncbi:MAG TPA: hypothetical protein VJV74_07580 [Terriglobia bacterium]|nr:hypothetical protein [Terriglobia bacterium]
MKKAIAIVLGMTMMFAIAATAKDKAAKDNKMSGWIMDEKCAAKAGEPGMEACAKRCIEGGQKAVFVSEKDKEVLQIANPEVTKGHEGHHVVVTGSVDNGTVHIDHLAMARAAKGK